MAKSTYPDSSAHILVLATRLRTILPQLRRRLHEHWSIGDLTPNQAAVISELDRNGTKTISELSRVIGVRTQSMGAIVAVLQADDYVTKTSDPNDGRQMVVSLSDSFRGSLSRGRASRSDWLSQTLAEQLSDEELQALEQMISLLQRIVDA